MDEKIISSKADFYQKGVLITPEQAMQLAIEVAYLGAPYVSPNPLVGCVIVDRSHQFLAWGYHAKYGTDHAEINALKKLNPDELKNATMYVTLEPCAHEGKTPSCAKHIATLPIKKVVYGLTDPNPLVSGQGAEILKAAGKTAVLYEGPLTPDLEDTCEVFLKNYRQKKIFVAAKMASSLDGQIALKSGESKWITSEASREFVHELRSRYDAILVGRKTIMADDPSLNIRHSEIKKDSKVIILDPSGTLLKLTENKDFKFLQANKKEDIFFATKIKNSQSSYQQIIFDELSDLMESLWKLGLKSIFIEGGAETYSNFLNANLIDRIHLFLAPSIIGAKNGISWSTGFGIDQLNQKKQLGNLKVKHFAPDIYLTGRL